MTKTCLFVPQLRRTRRVDGISNKEVGSGKRLFIKVVCFDRKLSIKIDNENKLKIVLLLFV